MALSKKMQFSKNSKLYHTHNFGRKGGGEGKRSSLNPPTGQ
jgi:hypothetical protein